MGELTALMAALGIDSESLLNYIGWFVVVGLGFIAFWSTIMKSILEFTSVSKEFRSALNKIVEPKKAKDYKPLVMANVAVDRYLAEMVNKYNSCRVTIGQFHNGEHSIANIDFLKYTVTNESAAYGVKRIQNIIEGIKANFFGSWIECAFNNKTIRVANVSSLEHKQEGLFRFIDSMDTKSIFLFPMTDISGTCYGMGTIEFTKSPHDLDETEIENARSDFDKLSGILTDARDQMIEMQKNQS